jgi:hypothetical protein
MVPSWHDADRLPGLHAATLTELVAGIMAYYTETKSPRIHGSARPAPGLQPPACFSKGQPGSVLQAITWQVVSAFSWQLQNFLFGTVIRNRARVRDRGYSVL